MRALLIDDHLLFAQGLRWVLEDLRPGVECVLARSIAEACAHPGYFDLILLDYGLPDGEGTQGLTRLLAAHEGCRVVVVSGETQFHLIRACIDHGACGFVPKTATADTLHEALRVVLSGGVFLPREVLVAQAAQQDTLDALSALTQRQRDCLLRAVQGKSNRQIAAEIGLGDETVKTHLSAAFRALGVSGRSEAVYKMATLGAIQGLDIQPQG